MAVAFGAAHDRGIKVPDYRSIPSVREIVLISTTEIKAEIWLRRGNGWTVSDMEGGEERQTGTEVILEAKHKLSPIIVVRERHRQRNS